jgi:hypothetical protein
MGRHLAEALAAEGGRFKTLAYIREFTWSICYFIYVLNFSCGLWRLLARQA